MMELTPDIRHLEMVDLTQERELTRTETIDELANLIFDQKLNSGSDMTIQEHLAWVELERRGLAYRTKEPIIQGDKDARGQFTWHFLPSQRGKDVDNC